MTVLLAILGTLFVVLVIGIPLIEKYSKPKTDEELSKITRYMVPLMVILVIATAIRYFMG
tara:strand:- start:288 stop:467 length:180 start_codon:yes stop_codon:yes gene_type:complete